LKGHRFDGGLTAQATDLVQWNLLRVRQEPSGGGAAHPTLTSAHADACERFEPIQFNGARVFGALPQGTCGHFFAATNHQVIGGLLRPVLAWLAELGHGHAESVVGTKRLLQ
jgi:hypothetical protein